jgi:hypothetical protein
MEKQLDISKAEIAYVHPINGNSLNNTTLACFSATSNDDKSDIQLPRFIVALSTLIGEGINDMAHCKYLITCNPGPDLSKDIQREGRIWRSGNPHKDVYIFRLYAHEDPTEKSIVIPNSASNISKIANM